MRTKIAPKLLSSLAVVLAFGCTAGCTSKKNKASKVLEQSVEKCRDAEDTFYEVRLMHGDDTQKVLTKACRKEMGKIELVDEFSAETMVGPYVWRAGLDNATGIWTMQSVEWKTLAQALKRLDDEDAGENVLRHAAKLLGKAQKQFPESGWIRLKRLETLFRIRELDKPSRASSLELRKPLKTQYRETIEWAKKNGDRETETRARLQIVDYYVSFLDQVRSALTSLGSTDVHLERAAKLAEERGHEERAKEYRKELEEREKKRPKFKKRYNSLFDEAKPIACEYIEKLSEEGIEASDLVSEIESARRSARCGEPDGEVKRPRGGHGAFPH